MNCPNEECDEEGVDYQLFDNDSYLVIEIYCYKCKKHFKIGLNIEEDFEEFDPSIQTN